MSAVRWGLLKWILPGIILLCLLGAGVWLWNWRPASPIIPETLADTSLKETLRTTKITHTFPNLTATSIMLSTPQSAAHLSARFLIESLYRDMGNKWYSGPVEMFYAQAKGGPFGGKSRLVWVVENHMPFWHSEPMISRWQQHLGQFKHNMRVVLGIAKPISASTYQFFDAVTGRPLGTLRQESGGF